MPIAPPSSPTQAFLNPFSPGRFFCARSRQPLPLGSVGARPHSGPRAAPPSPAGVAAPLASPGRVAEPRAEVVRKVFRVVVIFFKLLNVFRLPPAPKWEGKK